MAFLEDFYWVLALFGLIYGTLGVIWARTSRARGLDVWGRRLFVGTLLLLGAASLLAAFHRAAGLIPLGLSAGALVVLMLWETPVPALNDEH